MLTNHVTASVEAYLDNRLSAEERRSVEAHLAVCRACTERLHIARRLADELKPTMLAALGQPVPPPALRRQVLKIPAETRRPIFDWAVPGRVLNAFGTLAVMALLAYGVLAVVQGYLPGANLLPQMASLSPGSSDGDAQTATTAPTVAPLFIVTPIATLPGSSVGDTLPKEIQSPVNGGVAENEAEALPIPMAEGEGAAPEPFPQKSDQPDPVEPPAGTIAFAYFNQAPGRQVYETHLIQTDGSNHRIFPLDGVSEPALRSTSGDYQLAYRAYSEPTSPRSLLSGDLEGKTLLRIGGFWEDAQPDWSPTEDRLIYASQREVDRRWRLYTSWGDGSKEVNLRREGESPTFAPDGDHFAFVSCDNTGNRCGLWVGDLENSEYGSKPVLEDPRAKSPDWSPAAAEIAYMANPDDNWDLYLVNSNGTNVRRLTDDPAIDGLPAWSPDGQWLAFLSNRGGDWGIWLLHVASGETHQLFSFDGGVFTPPNRAPYGQRDWYNEQLSWVQ